MGFYIALSVYDSEKVILNADWVLKVVIENTKCVDKTPKNNSVVLAFYHPDPEQKCGLEYNEVNYSHVFKSEIGIYKFQLKAYTGEFFSKYI